MTTMVEATDTVCAVFKAAWDPTAYDVDWPNVRRPGPALYDGQEPWARVSVDINDAEQRTMGQTGARRFTRQGNITVQVFVPAGERGLEEARLLCMVALNAFEGISLDGVRFVRVKPKDVGPDGPWYQVNVSADFEFDEVK